MSKRLAGSIRLVAIPTALALLVLASYGAIALANATSENPTATESQNPTATESRKAGEGRAGHALTSKQLASSRLDHCYGRGNQPYHVGDHTLAYGGYADCTRGALDLLSINVSAERLVNGKWELRGNGETNSRANVAYVAAGFLRDCDKGAEYRTRAYWSGVDNGQGAGSFYGHASRPERC